MEKRLITPRQKEYILSLMEKCRNRRIEIPEEIIEEIYDMGSVTIEEASDIIENLKFELGME